MPGTDDERPVPRVVEMRRAGGLVAADAHVHRSLGGDVSWRILRVLAGRAVAHLALDVLTALSMPCQARPADLRAIDAADAARLLPTRHVTSDAVEAELFSHAHQRLVCVRMRRLRPERRRRLVALRTRLHPWLRRGHTDECRFAAPGRRAILRLLLRQAEVHLRHL